MAFRTGHGLAFDDSAWNRYRIEAVGDSLRIWVTDRLTTAHRDTVDREGYVGLPHHGEAGNIYRFRNIRIRAPGPR